MSFPSMPASEVRWTSSRRAEATVRLALLFSGFFAFFGVTIGTIGGEPGALPLALPFVVVLALRAWEQRRAALGEGEVEVLSDRTIVARARREVRLAPTDVAWAARSSARVDVETRSGRRLAFTLPKDEDAERFLETTGTGVAQRTMSMRLRSVVGPAVAGMVFFLLAAGPLSAIFVAVAPEWTMLLTSLGASFVAWGLVRLFVSPRIDVGIDGVTVKRGPRGRFIPYEAIARVHHVAPGGHSPYGLSLELVGGETLMLPTVAVDNAEIMRVVARIDRARSTRQEGAATQAFARRGASLEAWRARLRGALEGGGDFRRARIRIEDAERTVADPQAPLERRLGAALALREVAPERSDRIRFAAEAALAPGARRVLEAALADDAEVEAALAELDETQAP